MKTAIRKMKGEKTVGLNNKAGKMSKRYGGEAFSQNV